MTTAKPALKAEKMEGGVRLHPKGDIVASTVEAIKRSLLRAIEEADGLVTLDMALVKVVDSLGITLVLGLFKTCKAKELGFEVVNLNPDIHRVFKLFNLTKFFPVAEAPRD
jgi:anti-anti-sigma factor